MAFPSSFQARVREMEDTRQLLLKRLQAEKELHERKSLQLSKLQETLAKIRLRCFVLKQKDAEFCVKVLEKEEEMRVTNKSLAELQMKRWFATWLSQGPALYPLSCPSLSISCFLTCLQSDLNELEHRQLQRREYYEVKKRMMDSHQCKLEDNVLNLKDEVRKLRENLSQLEAHLIETQDASLVTSRLDAEVGKEERRKSDMLAQINALESQATKNWIIKMGLEQRVEQAREEVDTKKKTTEKQTLKIMEFQSENQSLENRVFEAIQLRDQRKRFGFGNHFRNKI